MLYVCLHRLPDLVCGERLELDVIRLWLVLFCDDLEVDGIVDELCKYSTRSATSGRRRESTCLVRRRRLESSRRRLLSRRRCSRRYLRSSSVTLWLWTTEWRVGGLRGGGMWSVAKFE
jgi:hypothetical protein